MSDLFHEEVPESYIFNILEVIRHCPQRTFQILTKRDERMLTISEKIKNWPANVWMGVYNMKVAGLTGGIATGKTTVSGFLREAGAEIIDADKIAHQVVKRGTSEWEQIVGYFGKNILLPDGEIDRVRLGKIVFHDTQARTKLNSIVHPAVFSAMERQSQVIAQQQPDSLIVLDVPLLIESNMHKTLPIVILVYIPESMQLERLINRDKISENEALARIRSQIPIEHKKKLAQIIIDNTGDLNQTRITTQKVFEQIKSGITIF